ncbi:glycosyltransferase [Sphingobacterium siyangense]|uniref:Glycosyltransferase involved in cell wall biosynthesis n=1 Tax=Sphingobacterium siyangense TaxID=459529 RepID=A0A562MJ83_9SPHI|nr:glycosyltransferase [Sphingobacterium siyangense]TWI19963.1 glycosyltransferase involved in cell wall biosynthesis [Sphingobacterium siyangense]
MGKKRIELWGSLPEPYGGVSVHVQRLIQALSGFDNISLLNFSKGRQIIAQSNIRHSKGFIADFLSVLLDRNVIVHLHTNRLMVLKLFSFFIKNRFLVTLHNKRFLNTIDQSKFLNTLKSALYVFSNDDEVCQILNKNNINFVKVPAFLPPIGNNQIILPEEFIEFRKRNKLIFSMSIFGFNYLSSDDYGIEKLLSILKKYRHFDFGVCLCISQPNEKDLTSFKSKLEELDLNSKVLFLINKVANGSDIWGNSDGFLRLNNTDIEGFSVKEALVLNTPVLASDVCSRPLDTLLYESSRQEDLELKFLKLLNENDQLKTQLINSDKADIINAIDIIKPIFKNILQ